MPKNQQLPFSTTALAWGLVSMLCVGVGSLLIVEIAPLSPLIPFGSSPPPALPSEPVIDENRYVESLQRVENSLSKKKREKLDSALSEVTTHFMITSRAPNLDALHRKVHSTLDGMTAEEVISFADTLQEADPLKAKPEARFEIVDWSWRPAPSHGPEGAVLFSVEVKNNTYQFVEQVRVEFATYDADGNEIVSTFTYVDSLPPGQTASASSYATYHGGEQQARIWVVPPS